MLLLNRYTNAVRRSFKLNNLQIKESTAIHKKDESQTNQPLDQNPINIAALPWGKVPQWLTKAATSKNSDLELPDIVLAADCFYDESLFNNILSTVYFLLKSKVESRRSCLAAPVFYFTYQNRCNQWSLTPLLDEWDLECEEITLESFAASSDNIALSKLPGCSCIQMYAVRLRSWDFNLNFIRFLVADFMISGVKLHQQKCVLVF